MASELEVGGLKTVDVTVKDSAGAVVGELTTIGGNNLTVSGAQTNHCGLSFATNAILPCTQSATNDNTVDLGANGNAFKDLYVGGIQFPATQAASADANNLDDYEEGTWTPSLGGDTTYSTQAGQYTKVGRLVNISCIIQVNVLGTGSTSSISGLPFTSGSGLNPMANGAVGYFASLAVAPVHIGAYVEQAATTMLIPGTTAAASSASPALGVFGDSARIDITATYFV